MNFEIRNFDYSYIKEQVNLIWEVTENWKHEYQTSLESVTSAYSSDKFDPTTRFYAFDNDKLVGYVTSAIVDDKEKGIYATIRLPVVKNNNEDITDQLYAKAEERLKELGASRIRSFAGEGLGNTIELAEKYGYEKASSNFKRSKALIRDLKVLGDASKAIDYTDNHYEQLKELFINVIYPGGFGEGILNRMIANKKRKESLGPNRTSWKLIIDEMGIAGFSSLNLSDHNPLQGNMPPIYFRDITDGFNVMNNLLAAHIENLTLHGMDRISTFISKEIFATEPMYNKIGFHFDAMYSCEKILK